MTKMLYGLLMGILSIAAANAQSIIPLPRKTEAGKGVFILDRHTQICDRGGFADEAVVLQDEIRTLTGFQLPVVHAAPAGATPIYLEREVSGRGPESYRISVTEKSIVISSPEGSGVFYGFMSLLQMMPLPAQMAHMAAPGNTAAKSFPIDAVSIEDEPRFAWRGLMLDVSRTFMSPAYLRKTIRRMAFYKLNKLHLHLTDDQGWRIPIQSYPLLTKRSAFFDSSYHEPKEFQGFYTRSDIQELIRYAAARHVDLVPEIESPGHSHAALYAYPALSCDGNIAPVFPFFSGPSVTNDVFCVGNPASLRFFQSAIRETAALFPSSWLHLGGDEVPRAEWEKCPKCQAAVVAAKLENTSSLQGYFMQQLHDRAVKEGKRPIAWDEILIDNRFLTRDWVIMSWRGSKPGLDAAAKGYDVILTPTSHLYFDYAWHDIDTRRVFSFDPFAGGVADSVRRHVLGIQANFWSHVDRTESRIDYQLYPRLLALAERAWSSEEDQDYEQYRIRQRYQKNWLDHMKVRYYAGDFR